MNHSINPTSSLRFRSSAFSLLELMIAIVILGLGLVMVATMFPVAWDRARSLTEQSTSQTIINAAEEQFLTSIQVTDSTLNNANLAGDLAVDLRTNNNNPGTGAIIAPADTRVHALNLENIRVAGMMPFVSEDPWRLEYQPVLQPQNQQSYIWDADFNLGPDLLQRTFHTARVAFHQRLYPPMRARTTRNFAMVDAQWDQTAATRTFCWSALYRIHDFGAPSPPFEATPPITTNWSADLALWAKILAKARSAINNTRDIDVYYVTLRRPSSTNRYAIQQGFRPGPGNNPPSDPNSAPNPYVIDRPPAVATPSAAPSSFDVSFPVPWRVQVEFPTGLNPASNATGIPTEIEVPACDNSNCSGMVGGMANRKMLVDMFPTGSQFIDEVNGQVYRVIRRRLVGEGKAYLTLDREVVMEDLDFPRNYSACLACAPLAQMNLALDQEELIRTVWVYPPPVDNRSVNPIDPVVTFAGPQPVISIETRNISITPKVPVQ